MSFWSFSLAIHKRGTAVIVATQAFEVVERDHFKIGKRKCRREFLADRVQYVNAAFFFDTLGE